MPSFADQFNRVGFVALVALSACSGTEPSAPLLPDGAVEMTAPALYQQWWGKTEGCSQLAGQYHNVRWYVVPNARTFQSEFGETVALWRKMNGGNIIILSGQYQNDEMVVRHEMLHALLEKDGHPPQYFVTDCQLTWETWKASEFAGVHAAGPTS